MKLTKVVNVGGVLIGGNNPIVIQSMTNTPTKDVARTVKQINDLKKLGCQIVRVAVLDLEDAEAIKEIKKQIDIPLVADIHFDYKLAIKSIESGADKIRINPGNIGSNENVEKVVLKAKEYHIPIRIGINSGSLDKDLLEKYGGVTSEGLIESMKRRVKVVESFDFHDIVLSIKATSIETTIEVNRMLSKEFDYPIHIGLTESGTILGGSIRSSYCLGTLLSEGIGNTIRVSLNGDPCNEIPTVKKILSMLHLYTEPTLICCPTCGRTQYDMVPIVNEIDEFLQTLHSDIKVAIMGCVVNGPGEARSADVGLAGGIKEGLIFRKGEIIKKVKQEEMVEELKKEIMLFVNENRSV